MRQNRAAWLSPYLSNWKLRLPYRELPLFLREYYQPAGSYCELHENNDKPGYSSSGHNTLHRFDCIKALRNKAHWYPSVSLQLSGKGVTLPACLLHAVWLFPNNRESCIGGVNLWDDVCNTPKPDESVNHSLLWYDFCLKPLNKATHTWPVQPGCLPIWVVVILLRHYPAYFVTVLPPHQAGKSVLCYNIL